MLTSNLIKVGGILMLSAIASPSFSTTVQSTVIGGAFLGVTESSLDNFGNVATVRVRTPSGGNAFDNVWSLGVTDVYGSTQFIGASNQFAAQGIDLRNPILLDDGSFVAQRTVDTRNQPNGGLVVQLVRVTPNGTFRDTSVGPVENFNTIPLVETVIIGQASGSTPNVFREFQGAAANSNGQVALLALLDDGTSQVVRIEPDGQSHVVIATANQTEINFTAPDINEAGDVAYIAQVQPGASQPGDTTHVVKVGNGSGPAETRVEIAARGGSGLGPDINASGTVVGYQPSLISLAEVGDSPTDPGNVIVTDPEINGFVSFLGLNDFGQVAYQDASGLYVDGELIVEIGGQFNGQEVIAIGVRDNVAFNNSAQALAEVATVVERDANGRIIRSNRVLVRFDPEGATPENPLVPFASTPEGENDVALNINNGLGVDAPIFVDPIVATGFTYTQGAGGANFATLLIPSSLPLGDDDFLLEFMYGSGLFFSDTIFAGEIFDFTAWAIEGVASFTLSDIDLAEMIDPTDPFVVGLTFVSGGFSSTLSIDAITEDTDVNVVPLPASLPLLLASLGGLGVLGNRRRLANRQN